MFPIGDDNNNRTTIPYINYLLLAINIYVFIFLQRWGTNEHFIMSFASIPMEILNGKDIVGHGLATTPIPVYGTILTAMFTGQTHLKSFRVYSQMWITRPTLRSLRKVIQS